MQWHKRHTFLCGGLVALGFSSDSKVILGASVAGRGLFSIATLDRIARDRDEWPSSWYRQCNVDGIGPYADEVFQVYGINSPTAADVSALLDQLQIKSGVTEIKGACISPNGDHLAVGFSDVIDLYEAKT